MAILFYTADLMFSPRLASAASQLGVKFQITPTADAVLRNATEERAEVVILDLSTPGLKPEELVPKLRALPSPPGGIIAYGPHVQEARLEAATDAGCDQVLSRGQFNARMTDILRQYMQ